MKPPTDIARLARFLMSDECRRVGFLTGAGVSVASGIPDFQSPHCFDNLQLELLTCSPEERQLMEQDPAHVVSWELFENNQLPYLEVRRPFILGTRDQQWKPTVAHHFIAFMHHQNKLAKVYTQNIDGLHLQTDIPPSKCIAVHGSIAQVACDGCNHPMDLNTFCQHLSTHIKDIYGTDPKAPTHSQPVPCPACSAPLLRPQTLLFRHGQDLTDDTLFLRSRQRDAPTFDVLFILGTSLQVAPANTLVQHVSDETIRVLIHRQDNVGRELGLGKSKRDLILQGDVEDVVLELISELGWLDQLQGIELPAESAEKLRKKQQETAYKLWF